MIFVRLIERSVSTPVSILHPWEAANRRYCVKVGWPPNGKAIEFTLLGQGQRSYR